MKKYIVTTHTAVGDFEDEPKENTIGQLEMEIEHFFLDTIKVKSGWWFFNPDGDGRTWVPEHQIFGVSYRKA